MSLLGSPESGHREWVPAPHASGWWLLGVCEGDRSHPVHRGTQMGPSLAETHQCMRAGGIQASAALPPIHGVFRRQEPGRGLKVVILAKLPMGAPCPCHPY